MHNSTVHLCKEKIMSIFMYLLLPVVSVVSATILAFNQIDGWGWFLFIAFLFTGGDVLKTVNNKK